MMVLEGLKPAPVDPVFEAFTAFDHRRLTVFDLA